MNHITSGSQSDHLVKESKKMSYFSLLMLMLVVLMMGAMSKGDDDFAPAEDIGLWTAGTGGKEDQEGDEYDELDSLPIWGSERVGRIPVNVDSFGAVGDGVADDTQVCIYIYILLLIFII